MSIGHHLGVALAAILTIAATASTAAPSAFSGDRAMSWLTWQCDLGARVPGSEAHAAFRDGVAALADSLGLDLREHRFRAVTPLDGQEHELVNLVISVGPEDVPGYWFGAHYDCRAYADMDPDPDDRALPVMGANDGASGVAVLLHLAEILAAEPPAVGVKLMLLDGEDQGVTGNPRTYCLGSARLASQRGGFGNPLTGAEPLGVVIVDMVAGRGLRIAMEGYSLRFAPEWTHAVFERAGELGLDVFAHEPGRAVFDDHVPFLEAGLPAVDLIDMDYAPWHTDGDLPDACDVAGPAQVGALLLDLVRRPLH